MKRVLVALGVLALAACGQSEPPPPEETTTPAAYAGPNNCAAQAEAVWIRANGADYKVDAATNGPSCAEATATLVVRGPENVALHTFTAPTQQIFGLRDATDPAAMQREITAWLDQTPDSLDTTAGVPEWRAAYMQPDVSEFPFYPEPGIDRASYLATRASRLPMYCYAQGRESLACVVLENGAVRKLGVQAFPG